MSAHPRGRKRPVPRRSNLGREMDILVNNVGGRRVDIPTEDFPLAEWQKLVDLNLTSALVCCQQIGKLMLARGRGSIVNITSIAGPLAIKGIRGRHYETAKAALAALTRSLAADWADRGVRVNAIAPGVFLTDAEPAVVRREAGVPRRRSRIRFRWGGWASRTNSARRRCSSPATPQLRHRSRLSS